MASRQVEWAHRAAQELRALLGNKCAKCGSKRELEFDCIKPMGHRHHRIGLTWRVSFYRQQYREANIQLLCKLDHLRKTMKETRS